MHLLVQKGVLCHKQCGAGGGCNLKLGTHGLLFLLNLCTKFEVAAPPLHRAREGCTPACGIISPPNSWWNGTSQVHTLTASSSVP